MDKTIIVRCDGSKTTSVDGDLVDVTLYNVSLSDLLCEFNIDEIVQALVDSGKSSEVIEDLIPDEDYED